MPDIELDPRDDDQRLLARVLDFYQRTLKDSPDALGYLRKRGITNGEAIEYFRIGYSDRTLGTKLPTKDRKAGREVRARLEALNIFRAGSGHEHFSGSVLFPIPSPDGTGRIVDIYGRKVGTHLRKGTTLDTFLVDRRQGVWNVQGLGGRDEAILCGSLFDALIFWNHGYRNVTCLFGDDASTDDLRSAFREFGIRRVKTTSEAVVPAFLEAGMECYFLRFPSGLGANEYARQFDDPAAALGAVIRKAEWLGKGRRLAAITPKPEALEPEATDTVEEAKTPTETAVVLDDSRLKAESEPASNAPGIAVATPAAPASRTSAVPQDVEAERSDDQRDEVVLNIGHRRYRVRGLGRNLSYDMMRVNVLATTDRGLFVDTFDLYSARHRKAFTTQAAGELGVEEKVVKKDLGRLLLKLEEMQDKQIKTALEPKDAPPTMTPQEKDDALKLLRDPHLLNRIVEGLPVVGEATNKLVGYLAAVSRKLDQPLGVIIQSASAAGKTSLMEAVLSFVPPEDQVKFSAMTGQSLY